MITEKNVRSGYFEHDEYLAVRNALPEHLRGLLTFAYRTGCRHSEIARLSWNQVDLRARSVRLEETKNGDRRTLYLDKELLRIFKQQLQLRKESKKISPFVFLNRKSTGRVKRFDMACRTACRKAKYPGKLLHDLHHAAIRNMVRDGIPEVVAMLISGHTSRSVLDRYNIVNEAEIKMAAEKYSVYLDTLNGTGTITDSVVDLEK